jgi:hypothetical protein
MTDPQGGFYSAEDADSVDEHDSSRHGEGLFYLWQQAEIIDLLGTGHGEIFSFFHGVRADGNALADPMAEFCGKNILYIPHTLTATAQRFGREEQEIKKILADARERLFAARLKRPRPHLDDKIITAWNGLMISAMAKGFRVTGDSRYLQAATGAASFLKKNLLNANDRTLFRRYREGESHFQGQLDDYAFFVQGLIDLYGAGFDSYWLELAVELTTRQIALFSDETQGAFFDSPATAEDILVRMKNDYDGAEPAGNSIAAMNLLRLARITENQEWFKKAEAILSFFTDGLQTQPFGRPAMAAAYDLYRQKPRQIIIVGDPDAADTRQLVNLVNTFYLPTTMVLLADNGPGQCYLEQNMPFMKSLSTIDNKATAYVCENFTCKRPVNSGQELASLIAPARG